MRLVVMSDFGYHYQRLATLGRNDVARVTADFMMTDATAGLGNATRQNAWGYGRRSTQKTLISCAPVGRASPTQTSFLQLAVAHADTSPVTISAERWLAAVGSEVKVATPTSALVRVRARRVPADV